MRSSCGPFSLLISQTVLESSEKSYAIQLWSYTVFLQVVSAESDPSGRETTTPASHVDIVRLYWQSEANAGEYDVPPAFRRSDKFPVIGYPDWPVGKPTPGTHCTGDCPNGQDCDCFHEIVFRFRIQHPHPMRRRLSSRKEEAAAVVPGEEEDDNKVKFF